MSLYKIHKIFTIALLASILSCATKNTSSPIWVKSLHRMEEGAARRSASQLSPLSEKELEEYWETFSKTVTFANADQLVAKLALEHKSTQNFVADKISDRSINCARWDSSECPDMDGGIYWHPILEPTVGLKHKYGSCLAQALFIKTHRWLSTKKKEEMRKNKDFFYRAAFEPTSPELFNIALEHHPIDLWPSLYIHSVGHGYHFEGITLKLNGYPSSKPFISKVRTAIEKHASEPVRTEIYRITATNGMDQEATKKAATNLAKFIYPFRDPTEKEILALIPDYKPYHYKKWDYNDAEAVAWAAQNLADLGDPSFLPKWKQDDKADLLVFKLHILYFLREQMRNQLTSKFISKRGLVIEKILSHEASRDLKYMNVDDRPFIRTEHPWAPEMNIELPLDESVLYDPYVIYYTTHSSHIYHSELYCDQIAKSPEKIECTVSVVKDVPPEEEELECPEEEETSTSSEKEMETLESSEEKTAEALDRELICLKNTDPNDQDAIDNCIDYSNVGEDPSIGEEPSIGDQLYNQPPPNAEKTILTFQREDGGLKLTRWRRELYHLNCGRKALFRVSK